MEAPKSSVTFEKESKYLNYLEGFEISTLQTKRRKRPNYVSVVLSAFLKGKEDSPCRDKHKIPVKIALFSKLHNLAE